MKASNLVAKAAIGAALISGSMADEYELSEAKKIIQEDKDKGKITFTYQTFMNDEYKIPRAFMKGKFELEDYRVGAWDDSTMDVLRICVHFGDPYNYKEYQEALKWEIHPDAGRNQYRWDPIVFSPEYKKFGEVVKVLGDTQISFFCGFPHEYEFANNLQDKGNNGIVKLEETYDATNKKASVTWMREFDPESPNSITLMTGQKYKLWLQWGTFYENENPYDIQFGGRGKTIGNKDVNNPVEFTVPIPPGAEIMDAGAWVAVGATTALALVASTLY